MFNQEQKLPPTIKGQAEQIVLVSDMLFRKHQGINSHLNEEVKSLLIQKSSIRKRWV